MVSCDYRIAHSHVYPTFSFAASTFDLPRIFVSLTPFVKCSLYPKGASEAITTLSRLMRQAAKLSWI
jgi:hypothetical protein